MRLDQSSMDILHIVEKVQNNQLDLQPDFQRGQVWTDFKKKRLIDTILRQWYIPAIHIVVNDDLDREEVLDGQQRLRTIIDFMDDAFSIDGNIQPSDDLVSSLHGMRYSELPDRVKSRFKRFTLTTVRLRDYRPEEPGELFFRLNQLTALTAAEQRNALIGEPRNQIKRLAENLEGAFAQTGLGFTNARMNFDDVLSRLAVCLEARSLSVKLTAANLERRYRQATPFSREVISIIDQSITTMASAYYPELHWKQNKATLFSWLFYICDNQWASSDRHNEVFRKIFNRFEASRATGGARFSFEDQPSIRPLQRIGDQVISEAINIFDDRASSRVNDVNSLLLRDLSLNLVFFRVASDEVLDLPIMRTRAATLFEIAEQLGAMPHDLGERAFIESELAAKWDAHREARQAR